MNSAQTRVLNSEILTPFLWTAILQHVFNPNQTITGFVPDGTYKLAHKTLLFIKKLDIKKDYLGQFQIQRQNWEKMHKK